MFFIALLVWLSFLSEKKPQINVLFFGDSITQQGTENSGYIAILETMLQHESITKFVLTASGIGGNTIADLLERIERDVISRRPDIVFVYAGVNDAWKKKIGAAATEQQTFRKLYQQIILRLKKEGIRTIVCSPAVIGEKQNGMNEMDPVLNTYCDILRNLAKENSIDLVDLRTIFMAYETLHNKMNYDKGILTTDGVHLNITGNELVAAQIFSKLKEISKENS